MTKVQNQEKNRLVWLDLLKALAAFMVCFYHLTEHNNVADFGHFEDGVYIPSITKALYGILSACVPLFFIASGETLKMKDRSWSQYIYKAIKIMLVAVIWGFICNVFIRFISTGVVSASISDIIQQPFYFWYFPTLSFVYLFYAVWQRVRNIKYSILFFILLLIFPFLSNLLFDVLTYLNPEMRFPTWAHTGFFRLYSLVYVFIPVYWQRPIALKYLPLLFILGVGLVLFEVISFSTSQGEIYDGVNACFPTIGALLIALSVYQYFKSLPAQPWMSFFSWVGRNCLGIYILHFPFIVLFNHYTQVQSSGWIIQFGVALFIILITSIVSSGLKKLHLLF